MDMHDIRYGPLVMNFETPQQVEEAEQALDQETPSQANTFMQELAECAFDNTTSYPSGQHVGNLPSDASTQRFAEHDSLMPQAEDADHGDQNAAESGNHEESGEAQEEDDDLFEKIFRKKYGSHNSNDTDEAHGERNGDATQLDDNNIQTDPFMPSTPNASTKTQEEHASGCKGTRTCSTPPRTPAPVTPKRPSQTPAPAAVTAPRPPSLAPALIRYSKLHAQARTLIPRLPLPKHRYWIAVLLPDKKPQNARNEKDFIWMKGNRLTTVQTVWQMYCGATATEPKEVVLLCAEERVSVTDQMRELRYCGKLDGLNLVVLQAVGSRAPEAKGRSFTANLIPPDAAEVVEIEDD